MNDRVPFLLAIFTVLTLTIRVDLGESSGRHTAAYSYSLANVTHIRWLLFNSGGRWAANEADCMATCVITFHQEFETKTNTTSGLQSALDDPHYFFSRFQTTDLEELCHLYSKAIFCTESCPEEETHEWMRKVFAVLEYICKEKFYDFLENLPCISMVSEEIAESCTPQCRPHHGTLKSLKEERASSWQTKPKKMEEILRSSCLHISCLRTCQRPILFSLCGEEAYNLVDGATTKAFTTALNALPYPNITNILPRECKNFRNATRRLEPPARIDDFAKSNAVSRYAVVFLMLCSVALAFTIV